MMKVYICIYVNVICINICIVCIVWQLSLVGACMGVFNAIMVLTSHVVLPFASSLSSIPSLLINLMAPHTLSIT